MKLHTVFSAILIYITMAVSAFGQKPVFVNSTPMASTKAVRAFNIKEINADLKKIRSVVPMKATGSVQRIIHRYLYENRSQTEEMIGRAYLYFPIFEKLLSENNAPEELKYLAVIESSLRPTATSRVGARGIWQFMPATGREYGLRIDDIIDERLDPEKATVAAIQYLQRSHDRFKDWTLALAAYNSGGGRVNRAVRRSHSKNFWRLKRYLPRETRSYVPAFIAATYVLNHYQEYGLEPVFPNRDLYMKTKIEIDEPFTFEKLANVIGVDVDILYALNPAYVRGIVPSNSSIYIPERVYPFVESYFDLKSNKSSLVNASFIKRVHEVAANETLWNIAQRYHCTPQAIMEWNGLENMAVEEGQALVIYQPQLDKTKPLKYAFPQKRTTKIKLLEPLPTLPAKLIYEEEKPMEVGNRITSRKRRTKLKKYTIRKTTSLNDMANWLGVSLDELIELNKELVRANRLNPGTIIKVPGN